MSDRTEGAAATGHIGERGNHTRNSAGPVVTRLFDALWPGASSYQLAEFLGTTPAHVRMWRTGARHLPQWVRDLATERMKLVADLLNEIPRGPGQRAGDKNLIRNLKAWRAARDAKGD